MQNDTGEGRITEGGAVPAEGTPAPGDRYPDSTTYRSAGGAPAGSTVSDGSVSADRPAGEYRADDPATQRFAQPNPTVDPSRPGVAAPVGAGAAGAAAVDRDAVPPYRGADEVPVAAGPRPRASLLATLGLIAGVAAALFVLSGALAGYGIALGVLAVLLSFAGMSATSRRHVAGKSDALFGLILGLGAIAVGVLALTGQFGWPNTDADTVQRVRDWLDAQTVDRF